MTDKQEIEALLEKRKPLKISENSPTFLQKIGLQKKEYVIDVKPLPLGVIYQITECLSGVEDNVPKDGSIVDTAKFVQKNKHIVNRVIAHAMICKAHFEPKERHYKFIEDNVPVSHVTHIFLFILSQADLGNFTNAIRLVTRKLIAKDSEAGQK